MTCDDKTVNYTAAQSEMMLPLLPLRRMRMKRRGKRGRELARNRFCSVGEPTSFEWRVKEGGREGGKRSKPEIKKSFSTIDHGRRRAAGGEEGRGRRGRPSERGDGHDRCQRGVMAMNSKIERVAGCPACGATEGLCPCIHLARTRQCPDLVAHCNNT